MEPADLQIKTEPPFQSMALGRTGQPPYDFLHPGYQMQFMG